MYEKHSRPGARRLLNPECVSESSIPSMSNHISIEVEDDKQYERFQQAREQYGLTWKGLLIQGVFHLEAQDTAVEGADDR